MSIKQIPTVVIRMDCGAIHAVIGNQQVRVILLDHDTDGADAENLRTLNGEKFFLHDYRVSGLDEDFCDPQYVAEITDQVDKSYLI